MNWTAEQDGELETMLRAAVSYDDIAAHFGCNRNQVAGRVNRLRNRIKDLPRREGGRRRVAGSRPEKPKAPKPTKRRPAPTTVPAHREEEIFDCAAVEGEGGGKPLLELREGDCRWPLGPKLIVAERFCGARQWRGAPYCAHHARLAYEARR
jgi:GcrA cell cycle regulator